MITYADLEREFGSDSLIHLPIERYARALRAHPRTLSPRLALPVEVPILYTASVGAPTPLFAEVRVGLGENMVDLVILGAVPADTTLLYCLDLTGGAVVLADLNRPSFDVVNTTMALFVEFLANLSAFIRQDQGAGPLRTNQARRLRQSLAELDPAAFEAPDSWWSMAFDRLAG